MQATRALREAMAQLLAANAATLAPAADGNVVALIKAAFTPSEEIVLADLSLANFDGSTPIEAGTGTQPEGLDPNTNDALITILPPAGGWRFETTGTTNLPQTIYGYALLSNDLATLFATEQLAETVTLTAVNQVVELPSVGFRQLANSLV